jgi:hypothetical protein
MAGSITVSSITLDSDNNFSIKSNTGATLFFANTSGVDIANSIGATAITNDKILSIANTKISGNIISSQITSVANTQLTGLIQAAQIGSANATLITSGTLPGSRLPAGSVLQLVNATRAGVSVSTTSLSDGSFGATASITPTSSNSKIYIIASGAWYLTPGTITEYSIAIQRNGATIPTANNNGLTSVMSASESSGSYVMTILDTPATTSATTYLVVARRINAGTCELYNGIRATQLNEITLMEIAA